MSNKNSIKIISNKVPIYDNVPEFITRTASDFHTYRAASKQHKVYALTEYLL